MSNETTILRFDFGERPNEIKPSDLADICRVLEINFSHIVSLVQPAKVALYHALPPRRGSIEFHFRPEITIQVNNSAGTSSPANDQLNRLVAAATVAGAATSIAAFLWTAVYGQNGVLHGALSSDPQPSANAAAQLVPLLQRPSEIRHLVEMCAATSADIVEIQLPDNASVVLFDRSKRTQRGLIGRLGKAHSKTIANQPAQLSIKINPEPGIKVQYSEEIYYAYKAEVVEGNTSPLKAVVVWASQTAPTPNEIIIAQVNHLLPEALLPIDPVPTSFEDADTILFVARVADWK